MKLHGKTVGLVAALAIVLASGSAFADFVFVKSAGNDTAQVGKDELKEMFTGKTTSWKNGQKVEIGLSPPGSGELKWLAQEVFGTSDEAYMAKIKQEVFKGDMKKPAQVGSAADCFALVKKSPGGICVVDDASAKSLPDGVAVLKVGK